MEDPQKISSSEAALSDSWTVLNGDNSDQDNVNGESEETSDAESLEVLEVEQADPSQNVYEEDTKHEDNEGTMNDSDSCLCMNVPYIHIVAAPKARKYIHHPNQYINMWLSVMMVIAIAITLGLGMGHYLGSKRFAKATDVIQHLQCKNHMLEMEFAKLVAKHKTCERNLLETLQENILNSFVNGSHENECPAEEKYHQETLPHMHFNKTFSTKKFDPVERRNSALSIGKVYLFNQNLSNSDDKKGDSINNIGISVDKLEDKLKLSISPSVIMSFEELKTEISSLHFLLKKWSQFFDNSRLTSTMQKRGKCSMKDPQRTAVPQKVSCKTNSQLNSGNSLHHLFSDDVSNFSIISSPNECYRFQLNLYERLQVKLRRESFDSLCAKSFKKKENSNTVNFSGKGSEFSFVPNKINLNAPTLEDSIQIKNHCVMTENPKITISSKRKMSQTHFKSRKQKPKRKNLYYNSDDQGMFQKHKVKKSRIHFQRCKPDTISGNNYCHKCSHDKHSKNHCHCPKHNQKKKFFNKKNVYKTDNMINKQSKKNYNKYKQTIKNHKFEKFQKYSKLHSNIKRQYFSDKARQAKFLTKERHFYSYKKRVFMTKPLKNTHKGNKSNIKYLNEKDIKLTSYNHPKHKKLDQFSTGKKFHGYDMRYYEENYSKFSKMYRNDKNKLSHRKRKGKFDSVQMQIIHTFKS